MDWYVGSKGDDVGNCGSVACWAAGVGRMRTGVSARG